MLPESVGGADRDPSVGDMMACLRCWRGVGAGRRIFDTKVRRSEGTKCRAGRFVLGLGASVVAKGFRHFA